MSERIVEHSQLQTLRQEGYIQENEIAIIEGDLLLAKNVLSQERRIVGKAKDMLKENTIDKRILKD